MRVRLLDRVHVVCGANLKGFLWSIYGTFMGVKHCSRRFRTSFEICREYEFCSKLDRIHNEHKSRPVSTFRRAPLPDHLEVIRHGIISICDQIDANMTPRRSAVYLRIQGLCRRIRQRRGRSAGAIHGRHAGVRRRSVGMAVRDGLEVYGRENLHKGDVVLGNHAELGQHLITRSCTRRCSQAPTLLI